MSRKLLIYGVTGFVGRGLVAMLADDGWDILGVSRKGTGDVKGVSQWLRPEAVDLSCIDAIINLAGEPVDQRWTPTKKQLFHQSRVGITDDIVKAIASLPPDQRPSVLINASAVGIYGDRKDETLDDEATCGESYLADLCDQWEKAALKAELLGIRVVCLRIGIVLGSEGRAFEKLKLVFKAGIGGSLGNGRQWMPWIHVDDLRRAIVFCLDNANMRGCVNGTAPEPERNSDFTRKMATAVGRWVFLPAPAFALRLVLGDFASVLLASQKAVPNKLLKAGFQFRFPKLETALKDLLT